jgi:5-methylcytosine-specific restriction endonuclease McrA
MSVSLRSIPDHELLDRTRALTIQERQVTLSLLLHLNEIERRNLFLRHGYSSLFDYCTKHLKLSESAAMRRIRTARCIAKFPEVQCLLETGDVNLSTVSLVSKVLTKDNLEDALNRIKGKSQREVEAVVVEYEPRAAVPPDRVRTVVVPVRALGIRTPSLHDDKCTEIYRRSGGKELAIASATGDSMDHMRMVPRRETAKVAVIQFSAREPFLNKVSRVRSLASHRLQGAMAFEHVFELLMDYFIEREDPARRQERRDSRIQRPAKASGAQTGDRHIPAHVRDQVFVRDKQQCTYVAPDGRRCGSAHVLQIDHIEPVARGGASVMENLRLLCAKHNRLEAERIMGRAGPPA